MDKKKVKILILLFVIVVSVIGGYLFYSNYMSNNFEKNLKEAFEYSEERVELSNQISADGEIVFNTQTEGSRIITDIIKNIDEIIRIQNNEIDSLEEASKYTQSPDEEKYIKLQIKLKNKYKEKYELYKEWYEYRVKENNIALLSQAYTTEKNEIMTKEEKVETESEEIIKQIKKILDNNPTLKQKLKNLKLKGTYIGENKV